MDDARHRLGGERRGAAGLHVDMDQHHLGGRREEALRRVMHVAEAVHALRVMVQKPGRDAEWIAAMHLAHEIDVQLQKEDRAAGAFDIGIAAAEEVEKSVRRLVEGHGIIAHVEMAVRVDPFLAHGIRQGDRQLDRHGAAE